LIFLVGAFICLLSGLYYIALAGLSLYGLHRFWLLYCLYKEQRSPAINHSQLLPLHKDKKITVQLPIFNERFVAGRLLDCVVRLNWPLERLEIQVLDDSTDDTCRIIDDRVTYWSQKGVQIKVLRRSNRKGFKAGALAMGLEHASGEFIAVFDADFMPQPDFLIRAIPYFSDPKVGMIQGRWGFINKEHSWFTGIQSLLLGSHFEIEHLVRFKRGLFFNFNGTAGIWRKRAIESAGGWNWDTVTEDLDLSYRAQLAGWRFVYLNDLHVPSELPVTLDAFRVQQKRWAKGSIQTAKKLLPMLLRSSSLGFRQKVEAAFHLLSNLGWLLGTAVTLTIFPVIYQRVGIGPYQFMRLDLPLVLGAGGAILLYFFLYAVSQKERKLILWLPLLPVLTVGLAPSLAMAVLEGAFLKGGVFERTPKFGCWGSERLPISMFHYHQPKLPYVAMNICLFVYTILPVIFSFHQGTLIAIPFLLIFPAGFFLMIVKDTQEWAKVAKT